MTDHRLYPSPTRAPPGPSIDEDDEEAELENEALLRAICSQPGVEHLTPDEDENAEDFYDDLVSNVSADSTTSLEEQDD
ncbi:hypothetical protein [Natrialba sp. SSL1]|uniref:hypothetical protein n=1 Tax=Natrialba sp. SSL1 TaxID=1869245 RepID=UPI0008F8E456|nr:hypothetical protein [Natrialba sp. SSL1]OIB58837.1 hypothetical protein BBD46_06430 [Natrialba sp. SSL1]